jgi:drug/metabolite transporter (DMT)-like permease
LDRQEQAGGQEQKLINFLSRFLSGAASEIRQPFLLANIMKKKPDTPTTPPAYPPVDMQPVLHKDNIMRGICFGLAAYFMFGIMQTGAKILSETHNVIEVAFYRNLIPFVPIMAYVIIKNKWGILKTNKPRAQIFRGIFGSISLIITFLTFHYLPMATATVILFTATILTPAIAFFVLKEKIGIHRWTAILFGLMGVGLMVHPSVDVPLFGIFLAFFTASLWAVINVTLRYLKTEPPLAVTFSFISCGVLIPGMAMPFVAQIPLPGELLLFLMVGITGGLGQYFLTSAFSMAPASLVSMFNYTGLIWATLFDIAIWNNIPSVTVFIGGAIILAANFYIVYRERVVALREKDHLLKN